MIERDQPAWPDALREHDERRVGEAELHVMVPARNAEGGAELGSIQALHLERAFCQVFKKCQLDIDAKAGQNQVICLGYTDGRCYQWATFSTEDFGHLGVVRVSAICLGVQRSSIEQQGHDGSGAICSYVWVGVGG